MKRALLVFCFTFYILHSVFSQNPGEWMWIHGSNTSNNTGSFGTQGVPSIANDPPAMYEPCEFTDRNGNFWFYGGLDKNWNAGAYNDLWRYNPSTKEWTWMTGTHTLGYPGNYGVIGVPSPSNLPPSRSWASQSWVDNAGNFWMMGGFSPGTTSNNALWKYDLSTNLWTWMKGNMPVNWGIQGVPDTANNPPVNTENAAAWTDNAGDLWLLATNGALWKYNIAGNIWTWMKGSSTANAVVYGAKGVEMITNNPGNSGAYCRWKDKNGYLWLYPTNTNALWRFNTSTNNWAMMKGDTLNGSAKYGTQCVAASDNVPGRRSEDRVAWTDGNNNLWMFGGAGVLNDLWMYSIATNEWVWVSGDNIPNPVGNWGALNISSPSNKPSGRMGSVSWTDGNCHLYLYGGSDGGYANFYNDLWVYTINPSCGGGGCAQALPNANFSASDTISCSESGMCVNFSDHSAGNPTNWQWLFPGAIPTSSSLQNPGNICYYNAGTYPVTLIVINSAGTDTVIISPMITLAAPPVPPVVSVLGGDTLISTHGAYYQWYLNGLPIAGAMDSFYVAHQGGTYSVKISDSLGCSSISNGELITAINKMDGSAGIIIYPNPVYQSLVIRHLSSGRDVSVEIYNVLGEKVYSSANSPFLWRGAEGEAVNVSAFSKGVYILQLTVGEKIYRAKFIKE